MTNRYVPLHCHSHYSLLDGYQTVPEYARYLTENGYRAGGLTDHGVVSGLEEFDYELRRLGDVKPILGIEAYLTDDVTNIMTDRPILDSAGRPKVDKKTGEPMFEKQRPKDFNHGCMWAENDKGLENLFTLSTLSYERGFYRKPRIDLAMMRNHHDGLFVSDGCLLSQVARAAVDAIGANDDRSRQTAIDKAYDWIESLVDIFGRDHVLIELHTWQFTNPGRDEHSLELNRQMRAANHLKLQLAKDLGLMTIAVNDAHYGPREDYEWHELEWSTTTKKGEDYNDDKTDGRGETAAWVMNDDEVRYWLGKHGLPEDAIEESIENTSRIADACNAHINRSLNPPRFLDTRDEDEELFDRTIMDGFRELVPKKKAGEYMDRLNREVELVKKCDLTGYFNTVADYSNFVRAEDPDGEMYGIEGKHASLLGPGRGSAGGSLVCYLMHITNLDPIKFGLIFERFLTAGRVISTVHVAFDDGTEKSYDPSDMVELSDGTSEESWHLLDEAGLETKDGVVDHTWFDFHDCPDIDLDFTAEVIPLLNAYLKKRYGEENFCHIGTFQELKLASAIKDIARVDGISPQEAMGYVRELEASGWPMNDSTLSHTFDELWQCIALSDDLMDLGRDFWERVWQWCGRYRSEGIHASGYVISKTSLMGRVPLRIKKGEDLYTSQWDYDSIVRCGFIKFDILKLSSLDTITDVYRLTHDGELDVQEAYREMRDERLLRGKALWGPTWGGDTLGIFQMDTKLGTTTAMNARINSLRDAGMLSAADRPGLVRSGLIDEFYKVRLGQEPVNHYHPLIDDILEETDGFILYQEQIMSIYQRMCGMTMGEADNVRKIFSKKKLDKVEEMRNLLRDSCLSSREFVRLTPDKYRNAEECFDDIWRGLSRTAEYSFNKSHATSYGQITAIEELYKVNFPAEFITASLNTDPSDTRFISWARAHGIRVAPPNVNLSGSRYELRDGVIYMPIYSIKGIGPAAVKEIFAGAPYSSFDDYLERTSGRGGRKKDVMTSLISIGAFDGVDPRDRFELMCIWKTMRKEEPPKRNTWKSARVRGRIEERLIGVSLSYDPVLDNREMLESLGPQSLPDVMQTEVGGFVSVAGEITEIRRHQAKTGEMAWVKIRLVSHDDVEVTVFPSKWSDMKDLLQSHDLVSVRCKRTDDYNGKMSLIAMSVRNMSLEDKGVVK